MGVSTLVIVGPVGTRWLFALIAASALGAWAGETTLGVIDPNDRIAYPCLVLAFSLLAGLAWRRPQRLRDWQRGGVTLLAMYFNLGMLAFTSATVTGPDPILSASAASTGRWATSTWAALARNAATVQLSRPPSSKMGSTP